MKLTEDLQKYLPLGYLFLVVMGIIKESVLYYQLGINILKYSTLLDILISPVADMTSEPMILFAIIIILLFVIFVNKQYNKNWVGKFFGLTTKSKDMTEEQKKGSVLKSSLLFLAIGIIIFFMGIGIGSGSQTARKIRSGDLKYTKSITFNSGETQQVYLIGSNSAYFFYIVQGEDKIKISPAEAITSIGLTINH